MNKSKLNQFNDNTLKLEVSLEKVKRGGIIKTLINSNIKSFELFQNGENITPREKISTKYPGLKRNINPYCYKNEFINKVIYQDDEYDVDFFKILNENSFNSLFGRMENSKYDIGPDIICDKVNINEGKVIELTESSTFTTLDIRSKTTIKGNEDYEKIQQMNNIYINNQVKSPLKKESMAQTNSSYIEYDNESCQTLPLSINTVGTQVHYFNIIDAHNKVENEQHESFYSLVPAMSKMLTDTQIQEIPEKTISNVDAFLNKALIIERILAQNTLIAERHVLNQMLDQTEKLSSKNEFLTYNFTLSITYNNIVDDLGVRCIHWNETNTNLLAVAYSKLLYREYGNKSTTVGVWNMKNQHTPERLYEFGSAIITCLKFSPKNPSYLAVGFYCGNTLIIDISSRKLKIVFQTFKHKLIEASSISGLFWSESKILSKRADECLMTCNLNGCIAQYYYLHENFEEKIIMQLSNTIHFMQGDSYQNNLVVQQICNPIHWVTKFMELNKKSYLVGTGNGLIYCCAYLKNNLTEIHAHFGPIRSLEKSPYSEDVYLTSGCDCTIKIWIGNVFLEPIITLQSDHQITKAVWSPTNSAVIVSLIDNNIYVWNIYVKTDAPILVHEIQNSNQKYSSIDLTLDGKYLCVSDIKGNVIVYAWKSGSSIEENKTPNTLMYCIAKRLYGQDYIIKTLCKALPEYKSLFPETTKNKNEEQL